MCSIGKSSVYYANFIAEHKIYLAWERYLDNKIYYKIME